MIYFDIELQFDTGRYTMKFGKIYMYIREETR